MTKKNAIVAPRTPEALVEMTSRAQALTKEIHTIFADTSKGFLKLAPLMAEVREKSLYTMLGYKNIDEYAIFEHGMSHGTVVGLNKVYALFGSTNEDKTEYRIPDQYLDWGYTKLHLFADSAKDFENAGIKPLDEFTPNMTIKEMRTTLAQRLALKAKEQEENAIDTTAEDVDNSTSDNSTTVEADKTSATATTEARKEDFTSYLAKVKEATADLSAFSSNEPKEVVQVIDTILGYIKTLEKTYNKAHATATEKKNK